MSEPLKYTFTDYNWLGNMAGFGTPTDVYHGTVLLGVIESKPNGYVIVAVVGPFDLEFLQQGSSNMFKSKNSAAKMLHKVWAGLRKVQRPKLKKKQK